MDIVVMEFQPLMEWSEDEDGYLYGLFDVYAAGQMELDG